MMARTRFPTTEQLNTAIAWLESNEGDMGEADNCRAVANYLSALEQDRMIRSAARKAKVSVARVRQALKNLHTEIPTDHHR